jgi:hypothetical protein
MSTPCQVPAKLTHRFTPNSSIQSGLKSGSVPWSVMRMLTPEMLSVWMMPDWPSVNHGSCPMGHSVALWLMIALRSRSASHNGITRS